MGWQEHWGKSLLWERVFSLVLRASFHDESAFLKMQMGNFYCCPLPLQVKFPSASGINKQNMEMLNGGSALLGELMPK